MQINLLELISWLVIGALAGSLASSVVRGRGYGLLVNIAVGLIGAVIGAILLRLLNINLNLGTFTLNLDTLLAAFIGALLLVAILGITGRRKR